MKKIRNIILIDKDLCNGCGQCIIDCAEGAIALIDGKAQVIADIYCDGLGACLGGCPTKALKIVQREADAYDEEAVIEHLAKQGRVLHPELAHKKEAAHSGCGCPGAQPVLFQPLSKAIDTAAKSKGSTTASNLIPHTPMVSLAEANTHWPLKLRLMSPDAPFLAGAHLLIAADCAAFASAAFNTELRPGKITLIACPKFEEEASLKAKLAAIIAQAKPSAITVARMEVPCCQGLLRLCKEVAGNIPVNEAIVTRQGGIAVTAA